MYLNHIRYRREGKGDYERLSGQFACFSILWTPIFGETRIDSNRWFKKNINLLTYKFLCKKKKNSLMCRREIKELILDFFFCIFVSVLGK